jgi:NAD-dependent DNA ligase
VSEIWGVVQIKAKVQLYAHLYWGMLILENRYNLDEVCVFDARFRRLLATEGDVEYVVEPKIHGLAVNLIYENGIRK